MLHFYINDGQGNFNLNPVLYSDHTRYIIPVYNPLTDYDLDGISDGAYHYCAPSGNQCIGGLQVFASSLNFEPVSFFFSDVNYVKALFDFDNSSAFRREQRKYATSTPTPSCSDSIRFCNRHCPDLPMWTSSVTSTMTGITT
jgi:hypothetical protein